MPTILSFDIGTRHLAYCAMQHTPATTTQQETTHITNWQVVDLMSIEGTPYDEECVWVTSKSWKVAELRAYLDRRHLSSVGTREVLLKRIHGDLKQRKVSKVTSTNLCVLASKLYAYLDTQSWMLQCNTIVLENQPCLTNPVMKSVQMLLYGYFLYNGVWHTHQKNKQLLQQACEPSGDGAPAAVHPLPRVMLTSATNKLKVCQTVLSAPTEPTATAPTPNDQTNDQTKDKDPTKPKSNYKQRKKDAIELTTKLLEQWRTQAPTPAEKQMWTSWMLKMENSCVKEKDDLSDSFLQGLYVLHQHVVKGEKKKRRVSTNKKTSGKQST